MKVYCIIRQIDAISSVIQSIEELDKTSIFSTLDEAKAYLNEHPIREEYIIELNLTDSQQPKDLKDIKPDQFDYIYFRGIKIPCKNLDIKECERANLHEMKSSLEKVAINIDVMDFSHYLQRIPQELLFLLFIDYQFFDLAQNWRDFHSREQGSVEDLFNLTTFVFKTLQEYKDKPNEFKLDLKFFSTFHRIATKNLYKEMGHSSPGTPRTAYTSFGLSASSASEKGIYEILQQIKEDKNPEGFIIAEEKIINIFARFCAKIYYQWRLTEKLSNVSAKEYFKTVKTAAIEETIKEFPSIPKKDVITLIEGDLKIHFKNVSEDLSMEMATDLFQSLYEVYLSNELTFLEAQYSIQYARTNALAAAGSKDCNVDLSGYTDEQLANLAQIIYQKITNGEPIHLFVPTITVALDFAEKAMKEFNQQIPKLTTVEQKIKASAEVIHKIENAHLYNDGNLRSCYLLLNFLLMLYSGRWAVLYDPNRIDAYSKDELCKQIQQGFARTIYIAEKGKLLLEKHETIERAFMQRINKLKETHHLDLIINYFTANYSKISQELIGLLTTDSSKMMSGNRIRQSNSKLLISPGKESSILFFEEKKTSSSEKKPDSVSAPVISRN